MIISREIGQSDDLHGALVTVGTMDGVHVGHTAIVSELVRRASTASVPSLVLTFDPHPRQVVQGVPVPLLTTIDERTSLLEDLGVDALQIVRFDAHLASLSPRDFVETILVDTFGITGIVVGYDHGFGKGRSGDASVLRELGEQHDYSVYEVPEMKVDGSTVSSSAIRKAVDQTGDVTLAAKMLGRPYAISGVVAEGDQRGRLIGFPTANIDPHPGKVIPADGVYKVVVQYNGQPYDGMLNIGIRPTFGKSGRKIEVHLLEFDGNLYGKELRVDFLQRLRSEQKFDSMDDLKRQLYRDRDRCRGARDVSMQDLLT